MVTEPLRILVGMHGHEPEGWTEEVRPALAANAAASIRVLVVDEPAPLGFTSLLPAARRRHAAAVRTWRESAADARRRALDELAPRLPARPEVVEVRARKDAGATIADHAARWRAHVVVVGRDARRALWRGLLPRIHERVVDQAPCTVIVVPAAPTAAGALSRRLRPMATGISR